MLQCLYIPNLIFNFRFRRFGVCTMSVFFTRPPNLCTLPTESPNLAKDVWNTSNCICWRDTTIIISSWSSFPDTYFWRKVLQCEVRSFFRQTSSNYRTFNFCEVLCFSLQIFHGSLILIHPSVMYRSTKQCLIWEVDSLMLHDVKKTRRKYVTTHSRSIFKFEGNKSWEVFVYNESIFLSVDTLVIVKIGYEDVF